MVWRSQHAITPSREMDISRSFVCIGAAPSSTAALWCRCAPPAVGVLPPSLPWVDAPSRAFVIERRRPPGRDGLPLGGRGGLPLRTLREPTLVSSALGRAPTPYPVGQPASGFTGRLVSGAGCSVAGTTRKQDTAARWWRAGFTSTSPPMTPDARHTRMLPFSKPTNLDTQHQPPPTSQVRVRLHRARDPVGRRGVRVLTLAASCRLYPRPLLPEEATLSPVMRWCCALRRHPLPRCSPTPSQST